LKRLSVKLACPIEHEAVEKAVLQVSTDNNNLRKSIAENEKIISKALAAEILQKAVSKIGSEVKLCVMDMGDRDMNTIRGVSKNAVLTPNTMVALFAKGDAQTIIFVIAASAELPVDLRIMLKEVFEKVPGKGGGEARFVQGSFNAKEATPICDCVLEKLQALKI